MAATAALGQAIQYRGEWHSPSPHNGDQFASALAAHGGLLVAGNRNSDVPGAVNSGSAYFLNSESGAAQAFVTNPLPNVGDAFSNSVFVGPQGVIVGTWGDDLHGADAGAAYIYDRDGNYRLPLYSPNPHDDARFGWGISMIQDRYLVSAYKENTLGYLTGAAYLFDADGTLLQTYHDPTPQPGDRFGYSVAGWGSYALVGCYRESSVASEQGAVYMFDTVSGDLVREIHNPTTSNLFGKTIAVSSSGLLAVASPEDYWGEFNDGTVFVYDLSTGDLLHTIRNPTAQPDSEFGWALTWSGNMLVVGMPKHDEGGLEDVGTALVFHGLTGQLVGELVNPDPTASDWYGASLASSGSRVFVGSCFDDAMGSDTGTIYAYTLPGLRGISRGTSEPVGFGTVLPDLELVPEPSTLGLASLAVVGLAAFRCAGAGRARGFSA